MCNDSRELKTAHSRSLSLVFSSLRSGSCCPAVCLVSRSERTQEFLLPVQDGRIFGSSGNRMLWDHSRYYGFGMDALVTV